jgi:hypothetical protein
MADTVGRDTLSSNEYTNILHGIQEHTPIPQTPWEEASLDEFGTPQESHLEIRRTDCAEGAPNNTTDKPLAKVLFGTPPVAITEGTHKISGPTETLATPPMNRSQPKPTVSPRAINLARTMEDNEHKFEQGYDSDGEIGPHSFVLEEEGVQDFEEEDLPCAPPGEQQSSVPVTGDTEEVPDMSSAAQNGHIPIAEEALLAMKRSVLVEELKKRGQVVSGKKDVLLDRLRLALEKKMRVGKNKKRAPGFKIVENPKMDKTRNETAGFLPGSYWKTLVPSSTVAEPLNPSFTKPRAPTIPADEADVVPVKHDFAEVFERPRFSGSYERAITQRNGRQSYDANGNVRTEAVTRKKGGPDPAFVAKHKLTVHSHPADFLEVFIPYKTNPYNTTCEHPSIQTWTKYTNAKAIMSQAGEGGAIYPDYKPFSMHELRQHLGLYIFNGLNPSPGVELKFRSSRQDELHGSDFVNNSFAPGAERRHRMFKAFFAVQNPMVEPPPRKKKPNWKIHPLIKWLNFLMPLAWLLGEDFAVDEQTIGFQGHHADKKRITYKAEGDGFQNDALGQDGWTHQVYFRNDPAPEKYLRMGLSPLHARVVWLFDCVKDNWHTCGLDNLYNSAKFCRFAYVENRVLINGVTRTGMRGLPQSIIQAPQTSRKAAMSVRGTVKAAVLLGDMQCPALLATSVYDTKPVHFLSTVCEKIKWMVKERQVFNVDTRKMETMRFLRLEQNDFYNNSMGDVDVSDQLRNQYRFDHWLRMRKWWWSILFWWLGVMLVNAYIMYTKVLLLNGVDRKQHLSHHDFRKAIAFAWINPEKHWASPPGPMNKKRKRTFDAGSEERLTTRRRTAATAASEKQESGGKRYAPRFNDKSLSEHGALSVRLNRGYTHYPIPITGRLRCGIHRWCGFEKFHSVVECEDCGVTLCMDCYKLFHTTPDLPSEKETLRISFTHESSLKSDSSNKKKVPSTH